MSVYHILVINRAGSLIFDWENKNDDAARIEKTFNYPLDVVLEVVDQKPTVVFGEHDGIRIKQVVVAVNGKKLRGAKFPPDDDGTEINFMDFISVSANFPLTLTFSSPVLSANEKIILSSMFHSLYTIAAQLSPVQRSSGIELLETLLFRLHCFQSLTGIKFIVVSSVLSTQSLDVLLRKIYELYADYALKNPFYSIDMPIRCEKFDDALKNLVEKHEKNAIVTL